MNPTTQGGQNGGLKKLVGGHKKLIAIAAVLLIIIIAAAAVLPRMFGAAEATRITTYQVEEITYGNVSTTISGSGTLTPVTEDTLSASYAGEAESVNFVVGDEVEKGDVLAVIAGDNGEEEITAPYDGVLIEFPLKEGDEVAAGGSVAMIMGKDGFTMGIAVDELDISSVKLDQEVTFSLDAVDEGYTGTVTAISYNGSASGGTTAYQITASLDHINNVYPGMSATAEIVIEDSGDGLLVPVDAVGTSGDMGGFMGGGMDFGDFDFENFDPSQLPQGGGSFPGMGSYEGRR